MNDAQEQALEKGDTQGSRRKLDGVRLIRGLSEALAPDADVADALTLIVAEANAAVDCGHIFLSRYEAADGQFRAIAWRSRVNPSDVSVEQKFMGHSYLTGQPVVINDLSQYNYRLRPGVARLGFLSLVGIPIVTSRGVAGVLEAFAERADHFSDLAVELLKLFAKTAAAVIERADLAWETKYRKAENDFLCETSKLEQASAGGLFYKLGETFAAVLGLDGIAVFGIEPELPDSHLQEVMAHGFSNTDIGRLKTLYGKENLRMLAADADGRGAKIVKQTLRQNGKGAAKLIYTVPIIHRRGLIGLVVFYWQQIDKTIDMAVLEKFIKRTVGHITTILGRRDIYANIQRVGFSDLLTGLANRRLFDYVLDRELKKVRRSSKPISLLMADLDHFKAVNDTYGHLAGDGVLEQVGAVMRSVVRNVDLPARYGGEEFAIILPDTGREQAMIIAERLRSAIAGHQFPVGNGFINMTTSVGGVTWSSRETAAGESSAELFITAADQALYQAKQLGRNVTVFASGT